MWFSVIYSLLPSPYRLKGKTKLKTNIIRDKLFADITGVAAQSHHTFNL